MYCDYIILLALFVYIKKLYYRWMLIMIRYDWIWWILNVWFALRIFRILLHEYCFWFILNILSYWVFKNILFSFINTFYRFLNNYDYFYFKNILPVWENRWIILCWFWFEFWLDDKFLMKWDEYIWVCDSICDVLKLYIQFFYYCWFNGF